MSDSTTLPNPSRIILLEPPEHDSTAVQRALWDIRTRGVCAKQNSQNTGAAPQTSRDDVPQSPSSASESSSSRSTLEDIEYLTTSEHDSDDDSGCHSMTGLTLLTRPSIKATQTSGTAGTHRRNVLGIVGQAVVVQQYVPPEEHPVLSVVYRLPLGLIQSLTSEAAAFLGEDPTKVVDTRCSVILDTGSNLSWLLGEGNRAVARVDLLSIQGGSSGRSQQTNIDTYHGVVGDHPFSHNARRRACWPAGSFVEGSLTYYDGDFIRFSLPLRRPYTIDINCFDWSGPSGGHRVGSHFRMRYPFAVVHEIHAAVGEAAIDGILALGRSGYQSAHFHTLPEHEPQSFLKALQTYIAPPLRGWAGPVMYWRLLPPTTSTKAEDQAAQKRDGSAFSWLALNNWPCEKRPDWVKIALKEASYNKDLWAFRLLSMTFCSTEGPASSPQRVQHAIVSFPQKYIDVIVDTGSSVSWVPKAVITQLRSIFGSSEAINNAGADVGNETKLASPDFKVSAAMIPIIAQWYIEYEVEGYDGKPKRLSAPIKPFICTTHKLPRGFEADGLLFMHRPPRVNDVASNDDFAIFGINFLQTMFVALHDEGIDDVSYMELAPQWSSQRNQFTLPPLPSR